MSVGLVSDELMLEIVKAELDRLKGKVRYRTPSLIMAPHIAETCL